MTASRVAVAVVAVVVLAWLGLMERDWRLQERGAAGARPGSTPAQLARAESDLKASRLLNPDPSPDLNLALLARARNRPEQALAMLDDVVRGEPDNLAAWAIMAALATDDPAARERAFAARRRLDPLNAR